MRIHKLIETVDGTEVQIGGALTEMKIGAVNGPLSEISVKPVSDEELRDPSFEGAGIRLQVADRVVWLEIHDLRVLMELCEDAQLGFQRRWAEIMEEQENTEGGQ